MMTFRCLDHTHKQRAIELVGEFPDRRHFDTMIDEDTTLIIDGHIELVFCREVVPYELLEPAYESWSSVRGLLGNRVDVVGTKRMARSVNREGIPSPRSGVNAQVLKDVKGRQGLLGWDRPGHETTLTQEHPEMLNHKPLIKLVDETYYQQLPSIHVKQLVALDPRWRLCKTAFSTIYILLDHPCCYHRDTANMRGVMTCLLPAGRFRGGELVLPGLRIAIALQTGDLLLFNPQLVHGNLKIEGGRRLSAAFYSARRVADFRFN